MAALILAFLIIVFSALVSFLAASSRRGSTVNAGGMTVLRMNRGYAIVAGAGTALLAAAVLLALKRPGSQLPVVPTTVAIAVGTLAVWAHLLMATVRLRVEFDRERIRRHGAWGKVTEVRWDEVGEVRFSKARMEVSLRGPSARILVRKSMIGFPEFLRMMKDRLDPDLARQAVLTIESLQGRL